MSDLCLYGFHLIIKTTNPFNVKMNLFEIRIISFALYNFKDMAFSSLIFIFIPFTPSFMDIYIFVASFQVWILLFNIVPN